MAVQHTLMTLQEQAAIGRKTHELMEAGRTEEASALLRTLPLPAYLAKVLKEKVGADFLIHGGWNLAEAEAEFGSDWLTR
jgi:hypothetical protein